MASGEDKSTPTSVLGSVVGDGDSVRALVTAFAGVLAGASVVVLGKDAVVVPLIGAVPGIAVGGVGLAVAFAAYQQWSSCNCGEGDCGCTDECADSCSYDATDT